MFNVECSKIAHPSLQVVEEILVPEVICEDMEGVLH